MSAGGAPAVVRIALLGGFAVTIDGEPVDGRWRLRKAKTLVKLLALAPGRQLHRDAAIEVLWPDSAPAAAANNLHQAVHAARQVLGAQCVALRDDLLVLAADEWLAVDVDAFQQLAERARTSGCLDDLRAALAAWTGTLLPEDAYEPWCEPHHQRLDEMHAAVASALAARLVQAGQADSALAVLEPLSAERPLDEAIQRARIVALDALGRRWDAIEVFERLRDALESQYAAEPDAETKVIYRRLLSAGASTGAPPHNLPEPVSSFVGRERELHELLATLHRSRLVTLTGPGGAGKSRLALELARRVLADGRFADGVWFVELAGVDEPELVTSTTAAALGLALPGGKPTREAVTNQLAPRSLLLVLDNCEHLLAAATDLATEVLTRCPDVTVVTTSREPLAAAGESVYRVPSLELPPEREAEVDVAALLDLEAVQLFVERARQTVPTFAVDASNAAAVADVCFRLDGMPLSLELAAARLAHLSVGDLAEALQDALAVLSRRGATRLDRQQTLAATLDWSHQLLDPDEQTALRRLAVFAGGFELQAVQDVCDLDLPTAVELVSRLVDKSLVEADTSGATARYRLLEVVRQYAAAKLADSGDEPVCRRRHRDWYAAQAVARDPDRGPVVGAPSPWFDVEQDNLRAAFASALAAEPGTALRLATATARYWVTRGLIAEAARWLALALDRCPERSHVRARALAAMALVQVRQGRPDDLVAIGDEIVDVLRDHDDPAERAFAAHQRTVLAFMSGDWPTARRVEVDDTATPALAAIRASAEHVAGLVALSVGDVAEGRERFVAALRALARAPHSATPYFIAITLAWVVDERHDPPRVCGEDSMLLGRRISVDQAAGHVELSLALAERLGGDTDRALVLIDEARGRFDALDDRYGQAYAAAQRGHTLRWIGDYAAADDALAESEALRRALRDQRAVAMSLTGRALAAAESGAAELARRRGREAVQMMERSGDNPGIGLTAGNLAISEMVLGHPHAALRWFSGAIDRNAVPGGHRALAWMWLMRAHLLAQVGADDQAEDARSLAEEAFGRVGDLPGLNAVQRARKGGLPSVADNATS